VALAFTRDPFVPRRRHTREVRVGDVGVGGGNPIRVQSMTTTDTLDTRATVDQCERLVAAGCEIVRITAPSLREAENLGEIARVLRGRGVTAPLVADIHFTPNAALVAAEHVEKVRINPGNFADKKSASTPTPSTGPSSSASRSASGRWFAAARSSAARSESARTTARCRTGS
jgi:(E)-4-hydroxy-3-methylbut-2-enyl-diphosphate synthase